MIFQTVVTIITLKLVISNVIINGNKCDSCDVNVDPEGFMLQHVVLISRHGLRAPAVLSNWSSASDYPEGIGYLTKKGKINSLHVGELFRTYYRNFLKFNPREIWVRSSSYPRCFETASLVLDAMYKPEGIWDFGYPVQPIPIIRLPVGNDVNVETCNVEAPKDFKYMYNETNEYVSADGFANVGEFFNWLTNVSGYPKDSSSFYDPIIDALFCQKYNGLPIPKWAEEKKSSMDWAMRRLSFDYWVNEIPYYGQYMGKMVAQRLQPSVHDSQLLSYFIYHDTTIQALLNAFGLPREPLYPSFLAALHFQLYKNNASGELSVRTIFHQGMMVDGSYKVSRELKLPSCEFPKSCSLEKFTKLVSNIYPDTKRTECNPINFKALL